MVLIGLETTRFGIGVGRVNTNIVYGSIIFALIAVSGILVVLVVEKKHSEDIIRRFDYTKTVSLISASFYGVAFGLALFYTIVYNLEALNIYLLAFLGIFWFLTIYYGRDWKFKGILKNIILSVSFSFGLIYGASLNYMLIPAIIYIYFGAVFLLQISKDLMNDCKHIEREGIEYSVSITNIIGEEKAQKLSLILDLLILIFLIIPMFPGFPNLFVQSFYIYVTIATTVFVGTATLLSFRMNKDRKYYRMVKILLRCGMFLSFTAFILANF